MDFVDHVKQQIKEYEMNMLAGAMPDRLTDYMWVLLQSYQAGKISKMGLQRKMLQIRDLTDMSKEIEGSKFPKKRIR